MVVSKFYGLGMQVRRVCSMGPLKIGWYVSMAGDIQLKDGE